MALGKKKKKQGLSSLSLTLVGALMIGVNSARREVMIITVFIQ